MTITAAAHINATLPHQYHSTQHQHAKVHQNSLQNIQNCD